MSVELGLSVAMIKSIQIDLVKQPDDDFAALLKYCKKLLEPKGTIEITSSPKIIPVPEIVVEAPGASKEKSGESLWESHKPRQESPMKGMLTQAGFSSNITISQSTHMGTVRTRVIATA